MSWLRAWKQLLASRPWTPAALTQSSSTCLENKGFSICCLPLANLQCPEMVGLDNLSSSMLVLWKGITSLSCCHHRKSLPPPSLKTPPWRPWGESCLGGALTLLTSFFTDPHQPQTAPKKPMSVPFRTISQKLFSLSTLPSSALR